METTVAEAIRNYAEKQYIEPARRTGAARIQIVAGDVHRGMGLKNRVPNVCSVLGSRTFLKRNGLAIEAVSGPPSGMGTRVTYTYSLGKEPGSTEEPGKGSQFEQLRGLLKEAFHSLGGGETFLRKERRHFYQDDRTDEE